MTPQNAASYLGLLCLLSGIPSKNGLESPFVKYGFTNITVTDSKVGFKKKRDCSTSLANTKTQISCAVTVQLCLQIVVVVF